MYVKLCFYFLQGTTRPDFPTSPAVMWGPETWIWPVIGTKGSYIYLQAWLPKLHKQLCFFSCQVGAASPFLPGRGRESSGEFQKPKIWRHPRWKDCGSIKQDTSSLPPSPNHIDPACVTNKLSVYLVTEISAQLY